MADQNKMTVIFDLGAVLIDWNPRYLYRKIFDGDEARVEHFIQEICPSEWNKTLDAGRPFAQAIAERSQKFPAFKAEIEAYWDRWIEMISGPITETVALLEQLSANGVPVMALTNWSAESFVLIRDKPEYRFLNLFSDIVVSGEIMMIKPDPGIYRHTLKVANKPADQCLFVDDSLINCKAASALGIHAHHFTGPEILAPDLRARGLIA